MTSFVKYSILDIIWKTLMDYSTLTYTLPQACRNAVDVLKTYGYEAEIFGNKRDSRIIQIEDTQYRIVRNKGWNRFEVILIE